MRYLIFGAQGLARMAQEAIEGINDSITIEGFVVSRRKNNASSISGKPVWLINDLSEKLTEEEKKNYEILIATPVALMSEIEELLENYGFYSYIRLDLDRWSELVRLYHCKKGSFQPINTLLPGIHYPFVRIFVSKSHKDKPIESDISFPDYYIPVQAGAATTDKVIARYRDNVGQHISDKNPNYCELTVLYWVWKNRLSMDSDKGDFEHSYYGLSHYRRKLNLNQDNLLSLIDNDIDVVLPFPFPYEPNIEAHHKEYISDSDWNAVVKALAEIHPQYAEVFPDILSQRYLFNCNLILAKKRVLADYCEWLFPILDRIEELSDPKGWQRADRYIGYIAETLETLYFMYNKDKLRIVYTDNREYA